MRVNPNAPNATSLDGLMTKFNAILHSMASGDKKEEVARGMVRDVRRVIEEPYRPRLLLRLKDIGDVPNGVLHKYSLGGDGRKLKSTTLAVWVAGLIQFVRFLKRASVHLCGTLIIDQLDHIKISLKGCLTSVTRHRLEEDAAKRINSIGSYCSPKIVGQFLTSTVVRKPGLSWTLVSAIRVSEHVARLH